MPYISFLFQKVRICTQWFAGPFSAHLTLNVSLLESVCVHNVPMMEKRCVAQMERPTMTYVSFSGSHAKATLPWRWAEKVHVKVGFLSCISSVCFVVPFGERGATKKTRNTIMTESKNKRRSPFTRKTAKFGLENEWGKPFHLERFRNHRLSAWSMRFSCLFVLSFPIDTSKIYFFVFCVWTICCT